MSCFTWWKMELKEEFDLVYFFCVKSVQLFHDGHVLWTPTELVACGVVAVLGP